MIDTVLLDADGVIQYPKPGFLEGFLTLLGGRATIGQLFAAEDAAIDGSRRIHDVLAEFCAEHSLTATPDDFLAAWVEVHVSEGVLELVEEIRGQGVRCYLATNQQDYRGTYMQRHLPYDRYFDGQFHSFELGTAKPEPAYFTEVLRRTGAVAHRTLFVDDKLENVEGARSVGLVAEQHVWHYGEPVPPDAARLRAIMRRHGLAV